MWVQWIRRGVLGGGVGARSGPFFTLFDLLLFVLFFGSGLCRFYVPFWLIFGTKIVLFLGAILFLFSICSWHRFVVTFGSDFGIVSGPSLKLLDYLRMSFQERPESGQERPKSVQGRPKSPQECPKSPQ